MPKMLREIIINHEIAAKATLFQITLIAELTKKMKNKQK